MEIITRRLFAVALLLVVASAGPPSPVGYGPASASVPWRDAPAYVPLFAPANQRAAFSAAVSMAPLESIVADVDQDAMAVHAPGSWQPNSESAPDVFGTAGLYNRWMLARLYGSRQVRVARGARMDRGRVIESWTLISPYPSTDLRTLHPGTLRLVLKIAP